MKHCLATLLRGTFVTVTLIKEDGEYTQQDCDMEAQAVSIRHKSGIPESEQVANLKLWMQKNGVEDRIRYSHTGLFCNH